MDIINNRRSVRKYKSVPIEAKKIDNMLRAAMQAPSAANQQPWEFLVIQEAEALKKLAEIGAHAAPVENAAAAFVLLADETRIRFPEFWQQDMAAATQNLLLEAAEMGIGCVWTGCAPDEDRMAFVRNLYDLPDEILPFCVIAAGYPADEHGNRFVDRYNADRIHYDKY